MPYSIEQKGEGEWCVYDNDTGKKVGDTYPDRTAAMRKMRELVHAEQAGKKKPTEDDEEED